MCCLSFDIKLPVRHTTRDITAYKVVRKVKDKYLPIYRDKPEYILDFRYYADITFCYKRKKGGKSVCQTAGGFYCFETFDDAEEYRLSLIEDDIYAQANADNENDDPTTYAILWVHIPKGSLIVDKLNKALSNTSKKGSIIISNYMKITTEVTDIGDKKNEIL